MFQRKPKRIVMKDLEPQMWAMAEIPLADLGRVVGGAKKGGGGPLCSWTLPTDPDGIRDCDA